MAERLHVFGTLGRCDPRLLVIDRHLCRVMARALTGDHDISAEENLAATYDQIMGGDDAAVGAAMTYLINVSSDPRDYTERVILACDLLRAARRTKH